jgi:urease accessory protein
LNLNLAPHLLNLNLNMKPACPAMGTSMDRVTRVVPMGEGTPVDSVLLAPDARHVQRGELTSLKGLRLTLDLPRPARLRMGDALLLDDGRLVEIVAEAEPLLEVRAADVTALARIAWQLGDRHVPVQILANRLRLRPDPASAALLADLGARVSRIEAPFDPEGGAYETPDPHHGHEHAHHHGHHDHDHASCGHDHAHDHGSGHRHGR